jgi:hypothetical protein
MFTQEAMQGFINTVSLASLNLPAEASKALLIQTAYKERDRVLTEARTRSGLVPQYRQIVDGVLDAPIEAVKPFGTIVFSWHYFAEVVREIVHTLADRSPVRTGAYLDSFVVFVDDVPAAMGAHDEIHLREINLASKRIVIVPQVPYSRRLEVGKLRDRFGRVTDIPFVRQVRPHIVEETAIVSAKLYRDLADISFNYVDLSDPWVIKRPYHRSRRHDRMNSTVRYPAIIIEPRIL